MGELATSLAHELNQPLTAILSNAQAALRFLSAKPADLEEVREILGDIVTDNSRAGEVIRRMRTLVKKEELEFAPINIAGVIGDVGTLLGRHKVNIASFALGRDFTCIDCAIGVVKVDEHAETGQGIVTDKVLEELRAVPHVREAWRVRLD